MPAERGSWEIARRLMRGYEFADPSIVRAYDDPALPLEGREMLLKLQALGLVSMYVGVRVGDVYECTRELDGRQVRVWGWNYRTLEGHVEMGQMAWEVWKWLDTGEVEFRVHSIRPRRPHPEPGDPARISVGAQPRAADVPRQHPAADANVRAAGSRRGRGRWPRSAAPPAN